LLVTLLPDHFTFKEVQEERPVGTRFMTTVMLAIGETTFHQTVVHAGEEVGAYAFIAKQLIYR
jgi:hypothetical protein